MKPLKPPHDPVDVIGQAYERLLEDVMEEVRRIEKTGKPHVMKAIETVRDNAIRLGHFSREEGEALAAALGKDLQEAARFATETRRELTEWWGFDRKMLQQRLLETFTEAADRTVVELEALQRIAEAAEYHTGEITGPGSLSCDNCNEVIRMKRAARIPPCPRCHKTSYRRVAA